MNEQLPLPTSRLILRPPAEVPAEEIAAYQLRNRNHFGPTLPPVPTDYWTSDFWRRRTVEFQEEFARGTAVRFLLSLRNDNRVIGDVSLTNIIRGPFLACHLGYKLDFEYVGRGLMFEIPPGCNNLRLQHVGIAPAHGQLYAHKYPK
jgi:[ribosomal protein S5]-alanine N-acetyltransferase